MNKCECYAIATNQERLSIWKRVFPPDGKLPVHGPALRGQGEFPDGRSPFYMLDMTRVTPEQKQAIIKEMAQKFHLRESEVAADIERQGVPVKASDVVVTRCQLHKNVPSEGLSLRQIL
jgi:hypothetical protein